GIYTSPFAQPPTSSQIKGIYVSHFAQRPLLAKLKVFTASAVVSGQTGMRYALPHAWLGHPLLTVHLVRVPYDTMSSL
ncbi:hypothetical protein, partial [Paenibacillus graminis]|uniref:hypothetical protein n=1 Tax=Paenibacillus graminis TaxID=189425 RepID=UPI0030C9246D